MAVVLGTGVCLWLVVVDPVLYLSGACASPLVTKIVDPFVRYAIWPILCAVLMEAKRLHDGGGAFRARIFAPAFLLAAIFGAVPVSAAASYVCGWMTGAAEGAIWPWLFSIALISACIAGRAVYTWYYLWMLRINAVR